ncbi:MULTISPECIES: hypothetical protein [unclassified Streptomyces]|uniref:hypothetical protein n=1 Tax=unclassified Streptomyces TaxID=2593676 RepID=UPI00070BD843|nr:hypothetical protein [Streptomyces sp. Root1310]KQX82311.1 hypothetical protein ASD48_03165 [Streptomyces sp. Root1310]
MLSEALTAAAAGGGMAVVQSAGADGWAWFRVRCARLVARGDADAEREALDRLDRTAAVLGAVDEGDRERVRAVHAVLWQGEFASLLESLPQEERDRLVEQLVRLTQEFGADDRPQGGTVSGNTFHGPTAVQTGDHNRQENHFGSGG